MNRNWDTIREILLRLEERPDTSSPLRLSEFPHERAFEYSYHAELLIEAGLVAGQMAKTLGGGPYDFLITRLTWAGHEFLDTIRPEAVWAKTKKEFVSKGVGMSFDLVKSVASGVAVAALRSAAGL